MIIREESYYLTPIDYAKRAYTAYGEAVSFKNYQGLPMPKWDDLPEPIKNAWIAAAKAIIATYEQERPC